MLQGLATWPLEYLIVFSAGKSLEPWPAKSKHTSYHQATSPAHLIFWKKYNPDKAAQGPSWNISATCCDTQ
jgi:hypothetical protein